MLYKVLLHKKNKSDIIMIALKLMVNKDLRCLR